MRFELTTTSLETRSIYNKTQWKSAEYHCKCPLIKGLFILLFLILIVKYSGLLNSNELNCLLKSCKQRSNQHLHLIVLLCLSTGARKGEILGLTKDLVDLDRQRVYLLETKNGERRMLSLKEPVLSLLKSHINSMLSNQKVIFMGSKFN